MGLRDGLALAACVAGPLAVGAVAGIATSSGMDGWYQSLRKPAFNPPGWVFGPVWTTLYALMGLGLFLVWRSPRGPGRRLALAIFGVQLALNFAWSFLFFRFHLPGAALAELILLWLAVLAMILAFRKVRPAAAWLQVPYLLWVGFAGILNASIWFHNR
jgi:tryptophan-rich sensory protein